MSHTVELYSARPQQATFLFATFSQAGHLNQYPERLKASAFYYPPQAIFYLNSRTYSPDNVFFIHSYNIVIFMGDMEFFVYAILDFSCYLTYY